MGGYEVLVEQPRAASSDVPFLCLTDDPGLESDSWTVVPVEPAFDCDHVRSSRRLKILGHPTLAEFDEVLWVDNRVRLRTDPHEVLDAWLDGTDLAMPRHSFRDDLLDEFRAVLDLGYDDPTRVYEQLWHYTRERPHVLEQRPLWSAIIARRASVEVEVTMRGWFDDVLRYSRRDQLSVLAALDRTGLVCRVVELDNHASPLHEWLHPDQVRRRSSRNDRAWRDAASPPALDARRLAEQQAEVEAERESLAARREELDTLHATVTQLTAHVRQLELAVALRADEAAESRALLDALQGSTSWRVTAPLRAATSDVRSRLRRAGGSASA
jgi:hypothetical protein